jgi:2,4-dienoyl-CoA reductase-like NADH-dependent reductase (Old Yellow Enzyme family)
VAGRIRSPLMAEEIIVGNKADMVNIGRSLIADPE